MYVHTGCAVGRGSFELARAFEYVIGLDFSVRFNRMGVALKEQGVAKYSIIEEGDILTEQEATLSQFNLDSIKDRVEFFQGDACNLDPRYGLLSSRNALYDRPLTRCLPARFVYSATPITIWCWPLI